MKTMKIWRIAFAMLAAFSLASCSNDDDELQIDQLAVMSLQVTRPFNVPMYCQTTVAD